MAGLKRNCSPSFRTHVEFPANTKKINHTSKIISIGSCFSENIALLLKEYLFNITINPSGILYNPFSISKSLQRLLSNKQYSKDELFFHEGLWKSFDHHSSFNARTWEKCLQKINTSFNNACEIISNLDTLIITFGTAFVYNTIDNKQVVANCHKLPDKNFNRSLLSVQEIVTEYTDMLDKLYTQFPDINIIITVSPVRHLRNNPHENQVSKAHLLAATYELEKKFVQLYYFPAYEIIMDELRDYRFYSEDMVHPAPITIDYVWERFVDTCIGEESKDFTSHYHSIRNAKKHRIKEYNSEATYSFGKKHLDYLTSLEKEYPEISFSNDKRFFSSIMKNGPRDNHKGRYPIP